MRKIDPFHYGRIEKDEVNQQAVQNYFQLIDEAEAFYNAQIRQVVEQMGGGQDRATVICLSGPSASGKTTTAHTLARHFISSGRKAMVISLDDFYMDTEQPEKIAVLLQNCEDETVLNAVSDYISSAPQFSPKEGTYSEVQEITITSDTGGDIYYTLDGTDPTAETGTKYTEPVLLQNEGATEIRAVAMNSRGIPSVITSGRYTIEFPIVDAPAVTPSTGQYSQPEQITITVPEGYTAYYTMDGTTPTTSSTQYTGPVTMPENTQTIFMAVLVNNNNGKLTEVTTRNYITMTE